MQKKKEKKEKTLRMLFFLSNRNCTVARAVHPVYMFMQLV